MQSRALLAPACDRQSRASDTSSALSIQCCNGWDSAHLHEDQHVAALLLVVTQHGVTRTTHALCRAVAVLEGQ